MGGEDFSYFAKLMPAAMLDLGVVPEDVAGTSVHSPTFIADEDAIPLGVTLMSAIIWDHQAREALRAPAGELERVGKSRAGAPGRFREVRDLLHPRVE